MLSLCLCTSLQGSDPSGLSLQGDKVYSAYLFTYGQQQINYMLGDAGRSYVVGFGKNPPNMPFHKWYDSHMPPLSTLLFVAFDSIWPFAIILRL